MTNQELNKLYNHTTKVDLINYICSHSCDIKDSMLFSMSKMDLLHLYLKYKDYYDKYNDQYDKCNNQYNKYNDQYDKCNDEYNKYNEHYDQHNESYDQQNNERKHL